MKMDYFYELFEDLPRQGPGCREATLRALALLKDLPSKPSVLDIGCGCGMQAQILARQLKTKILAIDNHKPMLDHLDRAATHQGLEIDTRELSMIDMPFGEESFNLPDSAWWDDYYTPMMARMTELKVKNVGVAEAVYT